MILYVMISYTVKNPPQKFTEGQLKMEPWRFLSHAFSTTYMLSAIAPASQLLLVANKNAELTALLLFWPVSRGAHVKNLWGGERWPLGTNFLQKWFRKGIMPLRHISILMADALYFYLHCLSYYISILIVFHNSCYKGSGNLWAENFGKYRLAKLQTI